MGVITVSRQQGSGGIQIALRACELLEYRYFDRQLMAEVMAQEHLTEQDIIDYHEDEYKLRSFMDRVLGYRRPSTIADAGFWDKDPGAAKQASVAAMEEHFAAWLVQAAIRSAYERGDVMIVGRGGQVILADKPGVLHVRIEAPFDVRVRRVAERTGFSIKEARQFVENRDKASAEYLQRMQGVDWADPMLYHLVINTAKWEVEPAAQCIVWSLRALEST